MHYPFICAVQANLVLRELESRPEHKTHNLTLYFVRPEDVGPLTPRLAARALLGLSLPPHLQPPESADQSPGSPASVTSVASPLTNNTLLTLALAKVSSTRSEAPLDHCVQAVPRRPRGEKKPIPEDLKDGECWTHNDEYYVYLYQENTLSVESEITWLQRSLVTSGR